MRSSTHDAYQPTPARLHVCVICDILPRSWPGFDEDAIALGSAMAKSDFDLICLGNAGCASELVARAVQAGGGRVTGIAYFSADEPAAWSECLDWRVSATSSQQRKRFMYEMSDAFIVLPGGTLVLETLMELVTWMQKGRPSKPVFLVSAGGYWEPLLKMFEHMKREDYLPDDFYTRFVLVAHPLESVTDLVRRDGDQHSGDSP